jgi:hypothetical protein
VNLRPNATIFMNSPVPTLATLHAAFSQALGSVASATFAHVPVVNLTFAHCPVPTWALVHPAFSQELGSPAATFAHPTNSGAADADADATALTASTASMLNMLNMLILILDIRYRPRYS